MAKYEQTKKKYNNKKKDIKNSSKLTARQVKQIARAAEKKATKKKETEKRVKEVERLRGKKEKEAKRKAIEQKKSEIRNRIEESRKRLEQKKLAKEEAKRKVIEQKKTEIKIRIKESRKRREKKQQDKLENLKKSQLSEYEINLKRLTALLVTQVTGSGQNIMNVIDDPAALKTNLQVLIRKYPELAETADKFLEQRKRELGEGIYRDEAMINQLEAEFRANPNRLANRNGVRYDSGLLDISAYMVAEAVYRVFKDEALERGISNEMFRRALDEVTVETPYLLYEGTKNSRGHISRERKFKSPREIANMVIAIALNDGHVDEREVRNNAW